MRSRRNLGFLGLIVAIWVSLAIAQDSQSLGDAARHARQQKQEKEAQGKEPGETPKPPKKTVTNDEIPEHVGSTLTNTTPPPSPYPNYVPPGSQRQSTADRVRESILAQKNFIASLQRQIESLNHGMTNPGNCITDCAQRSQRVQYQEARLDSLKAQLEQCQKILETAQESARKKGYGSSVYDP